MYLLETTTIQLREFEGSNTPPYAVLSHRWGAEEVSFRAIQDRSGKKLAGWQKIKACCKLAASEGHAYVWIDTCCIDKRSSQQLSEAINSMFRWYQKATICYVYLADVLPPAAEHIQTPQRQVRRLKNSEWFARGWTLQELLAPTTLVFYDRAWNRMGLREEFSGVIEAVTGIGADDFAHFRRKSVAKRMSWAARRRTTRPEDLAYCLLGLFDVNMPLLYGEGAVRAFQRLQREIIRDSEDESIFAWMGDGGLSGLLAAAPADFASSGSVFRLVHYRRAPYAMTNKGLNIRFQGTATEIYGATLRSVPLNCSRDGRPLVLHLVRSTQAPDRFCRIGPLESLRASSTSQLAQQPRDCTDVFVPQRVDEAASYEYPVNQWLPQMAAACTKSMMEQGGQSDGEHTRTKRRRSDSPEDVPRYGDVARSIASSSTFPTVEKSAGFEIGDSFMLAKVQTI